MTYKFLNACKYTVLISMLCMVMNGCKPPATSKLFEKGEAQFYCEEQLTRVIVHDIISPPVASRMYAYTNLAFYEALRSSNPNTTSLTARCKGFSPMPVLDKNLEYDVELSAATAFLKVAEGLVFSKDSIRAVIKNIESHYSGLNATTIKNSIAYGSEVATIILARAATDNYKVTRGMPRYSVFKETGKWQQTPPDYADAAEPYWKLIKPLILDSASQCRPPAAPAYSKAPQSIYFKEVNEVYLLSKELTPLQDSIAIYWDDNPFVTQHKGHLTFANKKITPVGHWMGITSILCKQYGKGNQLLTAKAFALTSAAIFDAFISCWDEKYFSKTVRPITVIREWFDPLWDANLQTPPFPEYTSGHSVISAAAATVLTSLFGNQSFLDTSELPYLGMKRFFDSPKAAAAEASISRLYGGIHFRAALEKGALQGEKVGTLFTNLIP